MKDNRWIFLILLLTRAMITSIADDNLSGTSTTTTMRASSTPSTSETSTEVDHLTTLYTTTLANVAGKTTTDGKRSSDGSSTIENSFISTIGFDSSTDSTSSMEVNNLSPTTTMPGMSTTYGVSTTRRNTTSSTTQFDHSTTRRRKTIVIDYFYYGLPDDNSDSQSVIDSALNAPEVVSYIANLTNDMQRFMVRENLRRCPLSDLCHVSLSNVYINYDFNTECCWSCSCEPECVRNGDCCPDAPWLFQTETDNITLPRGVIKTCLPRGIPERGDPLNNRLERIKAITGCPNGTDDELSSKCNQNYLLNKNTISLYDVTFASNDISGAIYRNIYCALCNGEKAKNLTLWQPELACGALSDTTFFSTREIVPRILSGTAGCDVVFAIPETLDPTIESCSTYVSRCNETGLWDEYNETIESACELYGHIIEIELDGENEGTLFRNPLCAICNGFSPDRVGCFYSTNYNERYTFSGLLRLQSKSSTMNEVDTVCSLGMQFDKIQGKCREVHCANGRELVQQRCLTINHIRKDMLYIITLRVRPLKEMTSSSAYDIASIVGYALYDKLTSVDVPEDSYGPDVLLYVSSCRSNINNGTLELNSTYFNFYDIRFQLTYWYKHNRTNHTNHFLSVDNLYIGFENQSVVFLDETNIEDANASFKVNVLSTNNTRFENVRELLNEIPLGSNFETSRYIILDEDLCIVPAIPSDICWSSGKYDVLGLRSCPMFNISLDEYPFERSIDGLFIRNYNITLTVSEYSIDVGHNSSLISVCIDLYNERFHPISGKRVRHVGLVEMVVSIVFVVISIVCLLFSLLTYCLFKQLQTLPGKNNMALIIWLLLAQTMYLIGSFGGFHSGTIPCKTIGLLTHFCWLVALFWMQVCTFHMFRVLSKMRAMNADSGKRKYILYHTYAVVMSTVFVLINVTVSMVSSDRTEMGYGTGPCYISSQTMIVLTFGLPTAFIVIGNATSFCVIVIKLKRAPDVNKNVQNERNYIVVFAKLSTVTGATWCFGLAYMWTGFEVLSYLFTILNASQGLFVMLGFVCNRRTFNLYTDASVKLRSSIRERSKGERSIKIESSSL